MSDYFGIWTQFEKHDWIYCFLAYTKSYCIFIIFIIYLIFQLWDAQGTSCADPVPPLIRCWEQEDQPPFSHCCCCCRCSAGVTCATRCVSVGIAPWNYHSRIQYGQCDGRQKSEESKTESGKWRYCDHLESMSISYFNSWGVDWIWEWICCCHDTLYIFAYICVFSFIIFFCILYMFPSLLPLFLMFSQVAFSL